MLRARIASYLAKNRWVLNLVFMALGSYFVAGAANAVVGQQIRVVPTVDDMAARSSRASRRPSRTNTAPYAAIADRNLMGAKRENLTPALDEPVEDPNSLTGSDFKENDLKPCSLPIALRATLVSDPPEWSVAVIYNNNKRETNAFSINSGHNEITTDATIVDIRSREIIVRRTDRFERCTADKPGKASRTSPLPPKPSSAPSSGAEPSGGGVSKVSETEYQIERQEIDRVLGNLSQVATKARIVPSFKNGKPNGFKLFSIKPGSIYQKIGLKNGDVIQRINGYEMNSPDKALEIYQKLKESTSISVDIQRRGRSMQMGYTIGR